LKDFLAVKTVLQNGVTVLCDADRDFESASASICLLGGLRDEAPEFLGVTHLLEHLLFKRSELRDTRSIACHIDSLGGGINAFTDTDSLCLYGTVPGEELHSLIAFFAELLLKSAFTEEDFAREREVVRQEILDSRDDPGEVVSERVSECFWPDDILRYPVFGTLESIERCTHKALCLRLAELLKGSRVIVSASGNFEPAKLEEQVAYLFSELPKGTRPTSPAPRSGFGVSVLERSFEQVYFSLVRDWPAECSKDFFPGLLLSSILGEGVSSRLFYKLREEEGLLYDIGTGVDSFGNTAMLVVSGAVEQAKAARVFDLILGEFEKVREALVSDEELERSKKSYVAQLTMECDSLGARLWRAVESEILYGRYLSPVETIQRVQNVTLEDIAKLVGSAASGQEGMFQGRGLLVLAGDVKDVALSEELLKACGRRLLDTEDQH
jgi:predicted Zn-dependent peptidase